MATATKTRKPAKPEPTRIAFDIRADWLKRVLAAVIPAASTDDIRPILTGVLITVDKTSITFVACDSYRIHKVESGIYGGAPFTALVPASWLARWAKTSHGRDEKVTVTVEAGRFEIADAVERSSVAVIRGEYPHYQPLIDGARDDAAEEATALNPAFLASALRCAQRFGTDPLGGSKPVRVASFHASKPCLLEVVAHDGRLEMLIMPVRVAI